MKELILRSKFPCDSVESKEFSKSNESSMELEDIRVFEEYNKEVDKLLGDESLQSSGDFLSSKSESSPSLSKEDETSDLEDSPVLKLKIWDNKQTRRDDSADFNKKFLKLKQKSKKKNRSAKNFMKKLENFKLEDNSIAKSAVQVDNEDEFLSEEKIKRNIHINNPNHDSLDMQLPLKKSSVSKKIQYLLNIEEFEKQKSETSNTHPILSTLNENSTCITPPSEKSPRSFFNYNLNSNKYSKTSYLNTPSTAVFSQFSPTSTINTIASRNQERRGSFISTENNVSNCQTTPLNYPSKLLSLTDKHSSYLGSSYSNLNLVSPNLFNSNNCNANANYPYMGTSNNIILNNSNNLSVMNSCDKNYSMNFNSNSVSSKIVNGNNNISPDYVNMRKQFSYPVESFYESSSKLSQDFSSNPYMKSFYNTKYPLKLQGTNLNSAFDSLNPAESPESQKFQGKKHLDDVVNRINLENILRGRDKRTTLMIRHIPNKYNLYTFLEDINMDFNGTYDVFYLPIDYKNNCNLGFAFINFVDPMHIIGFYDAFRGKRWRRFKSDKICELAYAKFQGKEELKTHFLNGSVIKLDSEDKKPIILPTPDPLPAVQIPLKFFDAFTAIYKFASCDILKNKFVVNSLYGF